MSALADLRVLFRAAAGPRRGFGHLVRCRSLARALGVRPLVCVRGTPATRDVALRLGCDVVVGSPNRLLRDLGTDLLVVDDPIESHAAAWIAAGRSAGVPVVTIHDLGIGSPTGDLVVDGSVTRVARRARRHGTSGPAFAILDPSVATLRDRPRPRRGVLVALGGGPHAEVVRDLAVAIARRAPSVVVRVAGGFVSPDGPEPANDPPNLRWLGPVENLPAELSSAEVAVVGGGISLYEACAVGTPAVGVAVVPAQRPTIAGFITRGAALGERRVGTEPDRLAADVERMLRNAALRRRVSRTARRLVDGRGAHRAARAIARLLEAR
jgi:spore coat polysaccharide biosynthesis predicted glycosyltransferase SpsG